jgi:hypothetical protein
MIELAIRFSIASLVIAWMIFITLDILQAALQWLVRIFEARQDGALSGGTEEHQP